MSSVGPFLERDEVSASELAAACGMSQRAITRACRDGRIPARKTMWENKPTWSISGVDANLFVASRRPAATPPPVTPSATSALPAASSMGELSLMMAQARIVELEAQLEAARTELRVSRSEFELRVGVLEQRCAVLHQMASSALTGLGVPLSS